MFDVKNLVTMVPSINSDSTETLRKLYGTLRNCSLFVALWNLQPCERHGNHGKP